MNNRSLRQEPRYEPAAVIPLKKDSSLIDWLESTGRLIKREVVEQVEETSANEELDEIADFVDTDDSFYDDDDDSIDIEIDED
jgi:hypothetical protein